MTTSGTGRKYAPQTSVEIRGGEREWQDPSPRVNSVLRRDVDALLDRGRDIGDVLRDGRAMSSAGAARQDGDLRIGGAQEGRPPAAVIRPGRSPA
jgi:hypothetical protein